MSASDRFWGVVPAAGVGRRMGGGCPKQYLQLNGAPLIEHSLRRLLQHPRIRGVVVAIADGDPYWDTLEISHDPRVVRVAGGAERCESVCNALQWLQQCQPECSWVLVHDAARPCLGAEDLQRLITVLEEDPVGGLLAFPMSDTVKRVDGDLRVEATLDRSLLWRAATPQMFRLSLLYPALREALAAGELVTDESSAMELAGHRPRVVEGSADNIKVTRPGDLELVARLMDAAE